MINQIGEARFIQKRLASRVDLDETPEVLWDHPKLERLWAKLVDEYGLPAGARAVERKLTIIRETAGTVADGVATRTSHCLEILMLALLDRIFK